MTHHAHLEAHTLAVIGLGKLGAPMAACLAAAGYRVIGVDTNQRYVDAINRQEPPVPETNLGELLSLTGGRLEATGSLEEAVTAAETTFIIVPTPSDSDGRFSLRFVLPACDSIGFALRGRHEPHLISMCSTVMPGSTGGPIRNAIESASGRRVGDQIGLCYSPEFIALGSVIRDFLNPDFVLIGESHRAAGERLEAIYQNVCENAPRIARMSFINAELTKISINSYVTTKITYANMIAGICQRIPEADVDVVTNAVGLDSRIGTKYLKGAIGYGGPCFPRDNVALARAAEDVGAQADLARIVDRTNRLEVHRLADVVTDELARHAQTARPGHIGILGLSYKPDTDVVEESQGVMLASYLADFGVDVTVYDPAANRSAAQRLGDRVHYASSLNECLERADLIVITTPWPEFKSIPSTLHFMATRGRGRPDPTPSVIVDCWRMINAADVPESIDYRAIGIGPRPAVEPAEVGVRGYTTGTPTQPSIPLS